MGIYPMINPEFKKDFIRHFGPRKYRIIVCMVEKTHLSKTVIAKAVNLPYETVKYWLKKAK
jgi:hypothetical protein